MRYVASEKLEIIRTVEQSSLGVKRTLAQIGIPRATFYNWYGRYVAEGFDGLEDRKPVRRQIILDTWRKKIRWYSGSVC